MVEQIDLLSYDNNEDTKLPQESSLNPRCWALYRLIKYNSLVEHRKTTQREICDKLSEYGYKWNDDINVHDHCIAIWTDIKNNNESLEHDKIIISKNFEYWIGSKEETEQFLKDLWKQLEPRLSRYWRYYKKINQDRQGKLLDKNNNPINAESVANRFFECFNAYNVSMGGYYHE